MNQYISNFTQTKTNILFYRKGKKLFFLFNNKEYECNNINISKLKEQLILPYKMITHGISRAQIGRIISDLLNDTTKVICQKNKNDKNNLLTFEILFFKKENIEYKAEKINKKRLKRVK